MTTALKDLRGASESLLEALSAEGIKDNEAFVQAAAAPDQRRALAARCDCEVATILELANRADLARISGVSGVYSDLLENAGVDTVKELATRNPANLHEKLVETNDAMQLTQRAPTAAQVEDWVAQAKALPKLLTY
jgi:predicted flap endonuclease-1-like 5' DNA nuclease